MLIGGAVVSADTQYALVSAGYIGRGGNQAAARVHRRKLR